MVKDKRSRWEKLWDALCPYCKEYPVHIHYATECTECFLDFELGSEKIKKEYIKLKEVRKENLITADKFIKMRDKIINEDKLLEKYRKKRNLKNLKEKYGE